MKITILTLFPEMFEGFLKTSIINKALKKQLVEIRVVNIRDFSEDKNKRVDDKVVGGGPGVILKCDPVIKAIKSVCNNSKVIYMSSKGITYNQKKARDLINEKKDLVLLCGHYEGIDERILDYVDEELSVGDYILTGGEIPAMLVTDSLVRLVKGVIKDESSEEESFETGLLEYPQYTLPKIYDNKEIPEILFSGNHKAIKKWRVKESLKTTLEKRKDLLVNYKFNKEEQKLLEEIENNQKGLWEIEAIKNSKKIIIHRVRVDEEELKKIEKMDEFDFEIKEPVKLNDEICFICKENYVFYKVCDVKGDIIKLRKSKE